MPYQSQFCAYELNLQAWSCLYPIVIFYIGVDWISVHLSSYLTLSVVENCLWAASQPDIQICSPHILEGIHGKGISWEFVLAISNQSVMICKCR